MHDHYLKMPLRQPVIAAKLICNANSLFSKLILVSLFFNVSVSWAQCPSPPGNPAVFGSNLWNVYGYKNSDLSLATAIYYGYYTESTLGFDTQNSWSQSGSPSNTE